MSQIEQYNLLCFYSSRSRYFFSLTTIPGFLNMVNKYTARCRNDIVISQ